MPETFIGHWTKFGATVKEARTLRGWSQTDLAARAGVSRSWVARVEAGHRGAEFEQILLLLAALDLTMTVRDSSPADIAAARLADLDTGRLTPDQIASGDPALAPDEAAMELVARHRAAVARRQRAWDEAESRAGRR